MTCQKNSFFCQQIIPLNKYFRCQKRFFFHTVLKLRSALSQYSFPWMYWSFTSSKKLSNQLMLQILVIYNYLLIKKMTDFDYFVWKETKCTNFKKRVKKLCFLICHLHFTFHDSHIKKRQSIGEKNFVCYEQHRWDEHSGPVEHKSKIT